MADLKLSPTRKHYRIGDKDDYVVLDGSRVIGRIFLQPFKQLLVRRVYRVGVNST